MLVDVTEEMIREQLQRILASPHFKSSRRCRSFLEYVVLQAASGHPEPLKERTIGVEVFGRDPDYDTNHDPVVRGTASEIRKRLAQFYQAQGNENQLRIDLSAGSYLPEFHIPTAVAVQSDPPSGASTISTLSPIEPEMTVLDKSERLRSPNYWNFWVAAVAVLGLVWAGFLIRPGRDRAPNSVDQFWAPILGGSTPVLLCVGQPTVFNLLGPLHSEALNRTPRTSSSPRLMVDLSQIVPNSDRYLALGDAMCLADLAAFFARRNHEYHVRGGGSTSFADLRENATVLIGGFTNDWAMRLTGQLRFTFQEDESGSIIYVKDRLNPARRSWQLTNIWPNWNMPLDYAIVTRVLDVNTGKVVVTAGGITHYGTAAAGEFLTDPKYLMQALKQAPKDWQKRSMEVVLSTRVIGGTAGPPEVLATHFQ